MKKHVRIMLTLAALILIAGLLTLNWTRHESSARQKLDNLLGQAPEPIPQTPEAQTVPDWFNKPNLFGFPLPQTGVNVQETAQAYVLRVPVATPGDADQVQVNVSPNRIEISGQTGSKQGSTRSTSSFFQSFTTSQPILPQKMSKKIEKTGEQNELVITIPKDAGSGKTVPEVPSPPTKTLPAAKQRQLQDELEQNTLDDQPHQVI